MASSNQTPDVLFSPIAANADASDINTIPQTYDPANYGYAAQNVGFPTECRLPVLNPDGTLGQGRAPRMQDWNGIMKLVSSHNFFLQNGGSYTFNPTVSSNIGGYPKNAVLWYFTENEAPCLVYSLINDNTNNFVNDPTLIDGTHWERLISPSSYANTDLSNLSTTGNDKFVTKNTNQTISGVKTFSGTNRPEIDFKNSSAVPASGQYYTGRLDFLDADNKREALIQVSRNIDSNSTSIQLQAYNPNGQVSVLSVYKYDDGTYLFYCPSPASATSNRDEIATTKWCQENIGVVDYSSKTDVTASVFAASGTGYTPPYKGVLLIKPYNSGSVSNLLIYTSGGSLTISKAINSSPIPNTGGSLVPLPVNPSFSYRVDNVAAGDSYALFCPYKSN